MSPLTILRPKGPTARELARCSTAWATMPLDEPHLVVGVPRPSEEDTLVLGEFERLPAGATRPAVRRGSGGGSALVGAGSVWVQLVLPRANALVADCTPDKLLNRHVRPLLRALTKSTSVPASYFGRDWVSAAHRPVALLGFAHEAKTSRCLFEAIVAVKTPFAVSARRSFDGKAPATLEEVARRSLDPSAVGDAIADAYRQLVSGARILESGAISFGEEPAVGEEPPWAATRDEAIGIVAAGRDGSGRLRVGGELMASRDAIARLEDLVAALPADATGDDVGAAVDATLGQTPAVTFGVRALVSIRDVIVAARQNMA